MFDFYSCRITDTFRKKNWQLLGVNPQPIRENSCWYGTATILQSQHAVWVKPMTYCVQGVCSTALLQLLPANFVQLNVALSMTRAKSGLSEFWRVERFNAHNFKAQHFISAFWMCWFFSPNRRSYSTGCIDDLAKTLFLHSGNTRVPIWCLSTTKYPRGRKKFN